ncbi:hypothetical protein XENORESO_020358, partial [Xenotaenia resolanae]
KPGTRAPPTTEAPSTLVAPPSGSSTSHLISRVVFHLVVFCPYFTSTLLLVSFYRSRATGRDPPTP